MKLLYRTAEWHGLAKLRMHTESSLNLLDELTAEFGQLMRQFRDLTCTQFATMELPRETAARNRREMEKRDRVSRALPVSPTPTIQPPTSLPIPPSAEPSSVLSPSMPPVTAEGSIPMLAPIPNRMFQLNVKGFR